MTIEAAAFAVAGAADDPGRANLSGGESGELAKNQSLRALARWFDRYLAPHGFRTRFTIAADGYLEAWVNCDRSPEVDRLVSFIGHRLASLQVDVLPGVRVVARRSDGSEIFWQYEILPDELAAWSGGAAATVRTAALPYYQRRALQSPARALVRQAAMALLLAQEGWASLRSAGRDRSRVEPTTASTAAPDQANSDQANSDQATINQAHSAKTDRSTTSDLDRLAAWLAPLATELGVELELGRISPTYLNIVLTGTDLPADGGPARAFQDRAVQSIGRRLWQAGHRGLRGVQFRAIDAASGDVLWQQTVRLVATGRRAVWQKPWSTVAVWSERLQTWEAQAEQWAAQVTSQWADQHRGHWAGIWFGRASQVLADPLWQRTLRGLLLGSATLVPFFVALWLVGAPPRGDRLQEKTSGSTANGQAIEQVVTLRPAIEPMAQMVAGVRLPIVTTTRDVLPVTVQPAVTSGPEVSLFMAGDVSLNDGLTARWATRSGATLLPEAGKADLALIGLAGWESAAIDQAKAVDRSDQSDQSDRPDRLDRRNTNGAGSADSARTTNLIVATTLAALKADGVDLVNLSHGAETHSGHRTRSTPNANRSSVTSTIDDLGDLEANDRLKSQPKIVEVKGQRFAYFSYNPSDDTSYGSGERTTASRQDERQLLADLRAVRKEVDWVVITVHWGEDLTRYPSRSQTDLGRKLIDAGADVVVGQHPQVVQGAEIYHQRPIIYSLGNLLSGDRSRRDYTTAALKLSVRDQQMKLELVPIEVRSAQPRVAKGDRGRSILRQIARLSSNFERPLRSPMVLTLASPIGTQPTVSQAGLATSDSKPNAAKPSQTQPEALGTTTTATTTDNKASRSAVSENQASERASGRAAVNETDNATERAIDRSVTAPSASNQTTMAQTSDRRRSASGAIPPFRPKPPIAFTAPAPDPGEFNGPADRTRFALAESVEQASRHAAELQARLDYGPNQPTSEQASHDGHTSHTSHNKHDTQPDPFSRDSFVTSPDSADSAANRSQPFSNHPESVYSGRQRSGSQPSVSQPLNRDRSVAKPAATVNSELSDPDNSDPSPSTDSDRAKPVTSDPANNRPQAGVMTDQTKPDHSPSSGGASPSGPRFANHPLPDRSLNQPVNQPLNSPRSARSTESAPSSESAGSKPSSTSDRARDSEPTSGPARDSRPETMAGQAQADTSSADTSSVTGSSDRVRPLDPQLPMLIYAAARRAEAQLH